MSFKEKPLKEREKDILDELILDESDPLSVLKHKVIALDFKLLQLHNRIVELEDKESPIHKRINNKLKCFERQLDIFRDELLQQRELK